jgi:hypothetical protein
MLAGCAAQGNCINDALVAACCTGCALGQIIAQIEEEGGGGAPDGVGVDSGVMDMTRWDLPAEFLLFTAVSRTQ